MGLQYDKKTSDMIFDLEVQCLINQVKSESLLILL